jgi:hypothetical protein
MKKLWLLLAAALLGAAMLPASVAAGGNWNHQGTRTAPVTVHCAWDAYDGIYGVAWTVAPDVLVQLGEGGFLIWAAASGKYSAPSEQIAEEGYSYDQTYYEDFPISGPEWPAGYITVQAVNFDPNTYSLTVIASGTARCQRADFQVF